MGCVVFTMNIYGVPTVCSDFCMEVSHRKGIQKLMDCAGQNRGILECVWLIWFAGRPCSGS